MGDILKPYVEEILTMPLSSHPRILGMVESYLASVNHLTERWDADNCRHWRVRFTDERQAHHFREAFREIRIIALGPQAAQKRN